MMPLVAGILLFAAAVTPLTLIAEEPETPQPETPQPDATQPDATQPDWVPLHPPAVEPSHERRVEVHILRAGVNSPWAEHKMGALGRIEQLQRLGELDPLDREIMAVLHYAATEGVRHSVVEGGRSIDYFPEVRVRAVRVLGHVGGPYARSTALEVIRYDPEPLVLGEATTALARMRAEADRELTAHLTDLVERIRRAALRQSVSDRTAGGASDDRLALTVLDAVDELDRQSWGGVQDPALFRAIVALAQAPVSTRVQRRALDLLERLRRIP